MFGDGLTGDFGARGEASDGERLAGERRATRDRRVSSPSAAKIEAEFFRPRLSCIPHIAVEIDQLLAPALVVLSEHSGAAGERDLVEPDSVTVTRVPPPVSSSRNSTQVMGSLE